MRVKIKALKYYESTHAVAALLVVHANCKRIKRMLRNSTTVDMNSSAKTYSCTKYSTNDCYSVSGNRLSSTVKHIQGAA